MGAVEIAVIVIVGAGFICAVGGIIYKKIKRGGGCCGCDGCGSCPHCGKK